MACVSRQAVCVLIQAREHVVRHSRRVESEIVQHLVDDTLAVVAGQAALRKTEPNDLSPETCWVLASEACCLGKAVLVVKKSVFWYDLEAVGRLQP